MEHHTPTHQCFKVTIWESVMRFYRDEQLSFRHLLLFLLSLLLFLHLNLVVLLVLTLVDHQDNGGDCPNLTKMHLLLLQQLQSQTRLGMKLSTLLGRRVLSMHSWLMVKIISPSQRLWSSSSRLVHMMTLPSPMQRL